MPQFHYKVIRPRIKTIVWLIEESGFYFGRGKGFSLLHNVQASSGAKVELYLHTPISSRREA
jgi:hypothetical protein